MLQIYYSWVLHILDRKKCMLTPCFSRYFWQLLPSLHINLLQSFHLVSHAWMSVDFDISIIKSIICVPLINLFLILAYKCLRYNTCSTLSNMSSNTRINLCKPVSKKQKRYNIRDEIQNYNHYQGQNPKLQSVSGMKSKIKIPIKDEIQNKYK